MAYEKVPTSGFVLKHHLLDMVGGGAFAITQQYQNDFSIGDFFQDFGDIDLTLPEEDPFPTGPLLGDVVYDPNTETFFYYAGEELGWVAILGTSVEDDVGPDSVTPGGPQLYVGAVGWSITNKDLYYWTGTAWSLFLSTLPTADPGGGHLWLSAS